MRAVAFSRYGGPEVLEVVELPDPEPGPGELRIRVAAATVNPADTLFRSGGLANGIQGAPPWVAGLELAGVVDAVGPNMPFTVGERVAAMTRFLPAGRGAHCELIVLAADTAVARVPEGLDLVAAATVPMTGLTVRLLLDTLALPPGSTLAVTGAAGAVGAFAVELAARERIRVIAIAADSDEQLIRELGAEAFVPRCAGPAAVRGLFPRGVDALIDAAVVGADVLPAVRDGGQIAAVRRFAGASERGIAVELVSVRTYLHEQRRLRDLLGLAATGQLQTRVAATFAPGEAAEAHRLLDAGGLRGRPVIRF